MNDIVVGIDRTDTAYEAALAAARLAAAQGLNLHLVMCADKAKPVSFTVGTDTFHSDWIGDTEQYLMSVACGLPHDRITHTVGIGDPATMLCEEARRLDASTIVVGNRGTRGPGRLFGSIAKNVTKQAPCAVMIANTCGAASSNAA